LIVGGLGRDGDGEQSEKRFHGIQRFYQGSSVRRNARGAIARSL
jgi:hypothetical protein